MINKNLDVYYHGVDDTEFEHRTLRDYVEENFDTNSPQDLTVVKSRRMTRKELCIDSFGIGQTAAEGAWEEWSGPDGGGRCDDPDDFDDHELARRIANEIDKYINTLDIYRCIKTEQYVLTADECRALLSNKSA